ncbi:MAG: SPOR domain-containing protein, partial [Burkholderiales bacterium]|nr:SPOR domain-containing protein [Burkholderiales bacterium]
VGASRPAAEAASTAAALAAEAKSAAEAAAAARATAARAAEAKAAETKVAEAKASEARAAEAKGADAKDAEAKSFVIQLGAFSDVSRAKDRHGQLVKAGIRSYTEVIKTPTGDKTRVRAGPFPSRQAAEQANERVKALGMTDGIVVPRRY